jgi:predicted transcriptional regulator of viral defense system
VSGYSPQLLIHQIRTGKAVRVLRGIYRLVHFPPADHEELVSAWLWSDMKGVASHQTALALHGLSDILPSSMHLSLPNAWRTRRFRVPTGIVLHYADVSQPDRVWFGAVPTTNVSRTLNDCARDGLTPDLLRQAAQQAMQRGLTRKSEIPEVLRALSAFGGLTR